jgi:hypothetical protein
MDFTVIVRRLSPVLVQREDSSTSSGSLAALKAQTVSRRAVRYPLAETIASLKLCG